MASHTGRKKGVTLKDIDLTGVAPDETFYKTVKALLEANDSGQTINYGDFIEAVKGFLGEYEHMFPLESLNYPEGSPKKKHIMRVLTTYSFVSPPKIKDQDRVEWGWKNLGAFTKRIEEMTGGDINIEVDIPYTIREKFFQ